MPDDLDLDIATLNLDFSYEAAAQTPDEDGLDLIEKAIGPTQQETPEPSSNLETRERNRIAAAQATASERRATAKHRIAANTDAGYFATIVFLDYPQLTAFLKATGWGKFGNPDINGIALAKHLGVPLPPSAYAPYDLKADERLAEISLDIEEGGDHETDP